MYCSEKKEKIKNNILKIIAEIRAQIPELKIKSKPVSPDPSLGRLTRMEAISDKEMAQAQLNRNEKRIKSLEETLDSIEKNDDFGFCLECEEAIPFPRLMSIPDAKFCIECG